MHKTYINSQVDSSLEDESRSDYSYREIVRLISNGELKPGDFIQERELALRLGVSRTPIREALSKLEGERILIRNRNGLLAVWEMTLVGLMEALYMRALVESDAAARAAGKIPPEALEDLKARVDAVLAQDDWRFTDRGDVNDLLHGLIAEHCGNKLMAEMIDMLRRRTALFSEKRIPQYVLNDAKEHSDIIVALQSGDGAAAAAAVRAHINGVRTAILETLGAA